MSAWIPVGKRIPWLPLPPYLVTSERLPELRSSLRDIGFEVFEADTLNSGDERAFLRAIGDGLPFPTYFGANWDAFYDCLGDVLRERDGPIALVITNSDHLLRAGLHTFVRSAHILLGAVDEVRGGDSDLVQFEIFFVGSTAFVDNE